MSKKEAAVWEKITNLKPWKDNPRQNASAIQKVADSIKRFGFGSPIVAREADKMVIAGNTRLLAAQSLGIEDVPVRYLDLDLADAQMLALADNKIGEIADWDEEKLDQIINDLNLDGDDLEDLGWNSKEIDDLIFDNFDQEYDDNVPEYENESEPISKLGEVYILGNHRLMCGDSTKESDVEKLMNGQLADMVFTDPPYGMYLDTDYSKIKPNSTKAKKFRKDVGKTTNKKYSKVIGDNEDFKKELITTIFKNFDYCKEVFIWGADYFAEHIENKNNGSWIVWDKRSHDDGSNLDKMFGSCFELCWSKNKHKRLIARIKYAGLFGTEKEDVKKRLHPTQKPILLAKWFFDNWAKGLTIVVDLYLGSGSTLIACEKNNKICYGMELDPKYCDVIRKRWFTYAKENNLDVGDGLDGT